MGCTQSQATAAINTQLPQVLFIVGGPGCGKGTQCQNMVKDFGFIHLSSGDLIREQTKKGGPLADEMNKLMKEGKLIDSKIVVALFQKKFVEHGNKNYLLDGFPRNDENYNVLVEKLKGKIQQRGLLYFECSNEVMTKRLLQRAKTSGRADDNPETIKKRLQTFQKETKILLEHYEKNHGGMVMRVNAQTDKEKVYAQTKKMLESKGFKPK